jgi:hypothetical protein
MRKFLRLKGEPVFAGILVGSEKFPHETTLLCH